MISTVVLHALILAFLRWGTSGPSEEVAEIIAFHHTEYEAISKDLGVPESLFKPFVESTKGEPIP